MSNETMFQEAMTAAAAGQRERARDLLTRLLKTNQNNVDYWLWMSAMVDTPHERVYCLEKVLKLEPQNVAARRGLTILGALPPDDTLAPPITPARRKWGPADLQPEKKGAAVQTSRKPSALNAPFVQRVWSNPIMRYSLLGAGAIFVLCLLIGGVTSIFRPAPTPTAIVRVVTPTRRTTVAPSPSPTSKATSSPVVRSPTPTFIGATPLAYFLEATYTATPRYIETAHPIIGSYGAGLRAYDRQDYTTMLNYMEQAAHDDPNSADILYYLGVARLRMAKYEDALRSFNDAIKLNPGFAPAYLGRAQALLGINPKTDVLNDLDKAIEIDPRLADAYLERAKFYFYNKSDPETALTDLAKLGQVRPEDPQLYMLRAEIYLSTDEIDLALENALEAHKLDFTLLPAYRALGLAYLAKGQPADAKQYLETYVQYEEGDTQAWTGLGEIYLGLERYEDALEALDKALKLDTRSAAGHYARGLVYLAMEDPKKALTDLLDAQRLKPQNFMYNLDLARAFLANERWGDAWKQLNAAENLAETNGEFAAVYYWRAQALEAAQNTTAALRDWQLLLALPPEDVPTEWLKTAVTHLEAIISPTPTTTLAPDTTREPTATQTPHPTATETPTSP